MILELTEVVHEVDHDCAHDGRTNQLGGSQRVKGNARVRRGFPSSHVSMQRHLCYLVIVFKFGPTVASRSS